ncbi:MAG: hypothetical protein LBP71_01315 [Spirochaetaceae bacterium]|jgi:uncharacterized integral membrane protein|nr:hypothetical protein [Spirochaetaceae bacterium]
MPWRLIGFVVFFGILLVFIGLNLNNSCDISFGFTTIEAVPIYLTVFSAFVLGLFCTIPLMVSLRFRKSKSRDAPAVDAGDTKNHKAGKKRNKKKDENPAEDVVQVPFDGGGSYGIN